MEPTELIVFPIVSDAYWSAGGRLPRQGGGAGGLDWDSMPGVATALTPVALALGSFALSVLADALRQFGNAAAKDAYAGVRKRLMREESPPLPELPGVAYDKLRTQILDEAQKLLAPPRAEAFTAAVLERIARRADEST